MADKAGRQTTDDELRDLIGSLRDLAAAVTSRAQPGSSEPTRQQAATLFRFRVLSGLLGRGNVADPTDPYAGSLATFRPPARGAKTLEVTRLTGKALSEGDRVELILAGGRSKTRGVDARGRVPLDGVDPGQILQVFIVNDVQLTDLIRG